MQLKEVRFTELDAVRGFAALSVLVFHFCLMWHPKEYFEHGWESILYPFMAGPEAVLLFFVLSGLALSKMLSGPRRSFQSYAARRTIRIYGPYFVALFLSIAGATLWHSDIRFGRWSGKTWSEPIDPFLVLQHVLFLGKYRYAEYNLSFWSLIHELRISLLFPLLYVVIKGIRPVVALSVAILSSMFAQAMAQQHTTMQNVWTTGAYIGLFACGILIAEHAEAISQWVCGLTRLARILFGVVSFVLYGEGHKLGSLPAVWRLQEWPVVAGAVGLIILAMNSVSTKRFLQMRFPQFLGRISYSLYLTHGTVLFALTALVWGKISPSYFVVLYVLAALIVGTVFNRFVEQRFIDLSRSVTVKEPAKTEALV